MRVPLVAALAVNQNSSMDFFSDAIARPGAISRRVKYLTAADDFSHECVGITADFGIGEDYVTRLLDRAASFRGPRNQPGATVIAWSAGWPDDLPSKLNLISRLRVFTGQSF